MLDAGASHAIQPEVPPDVREHHRCYGNRAGWIVATTHPQAELWANANLQRRGYRTYLPLYAAVRRDRVLRTLTHTVLRPLFPSYLFCWYDARDPRRPIRETPGVRDVIRCGAEIQWANAGDISVLEATEASRRCLTPETASWASGTPCRLRTGILAGHPAVVLSVRRDTARVAVLLLGALRAVSVPVGQLAPREAA